MSVIWKKSFPMSFNIFFWCLWCSFWHLCCSLAPLVTPKNNSMHPLTFNFPMPLSSPNTPCHIREIHFYPFIHQNPWHPPQSFSHPHCSSSTLVIPPCHSLRSSIISHHSPHHLDIFPPLTKLNWNILEPKHPISKQFFYLWCLELRHLASQHPIMGHSQDVFSKP